MFNQDIEATGSVAQSAGRELIQFSGALLSNHSGNSTHSTGHHNSTHHGYQPFNWDTTDGKITILAISIGGAALVALILLKIVVGAGLYFNRTRRGYARLPSGDDGHIQQSDIIPSPATPGFGASPTAMGGE